MSKGDRIDILHLSTSHRAEDNRIFHSQAKTQAKKYKVAIAGLNPPADEVDGVKFFKVPQISILKRILFAIKLGMKINPRLVQIHDPEMMVPALWFRLLGKKVVYDLHEDYEMKFNTNRSSGKLAGKTWFWLEKICIFFFNYIIAADSHIQRKLNKKKSIVIGNFPPISFFLNSSRKIDKPIEEEFRLVYVGTIHELRGLRKAVEVMDNLNIPNARLHVIGDCRYPDLLELFQSHPKVKFHGRIAWEKLNDELSKCHLGLILFQPVPAFTYYPGENIVKLFEYASLGIPFLISDFPGLVNFVQTNGGGVNVDPTDAPSIARAVERLYSDKVLYARLSEEGRTMVREKFNWEKQEEKLMKLYAELLD